MVPGHILRFFDLDPVPGDGTSVAFVTTGVDSQIPDPDVGPVSSGQREQLVACRCGGHESLAEGATP